MTPDQLKAIACDRGVHPVVSVESQPDGGLRETCDRCGHVQTFTADEVSNVDADGDDCVADDSTECDCSRCAGDRAEWERWQGWEDDIGYTADSERDDYDQDDDEDPEDGDEDRDDECIGAGCINPHPVHGRDECYTEAWAREYFAGERAPKRRRRRVRMARKKRRGWA